MLNHLFSFSKLKSLSYIEYIIFKNRNQSDYEMTGEYSTAIILLLVIFFRIWNNQIEEFILPWWYLMLISLLLFQKVAVFLLKCLLFFPVCLLTVLCRCICFNDCSCTKKRAKMQRKEIYKMNSAV